MQDQCKHVVKTALIVKAKVMSHLHFCLFSAGTPQDKLRLFIIYFISGPTMSPVRSKQLSLNQYQSNHNFDQSEQTKAKTMNQ